MHYQIYLPGKTACNRNDLIDVGLADHVDGCDRVTRQEGPDGKGGSYCAWLKSGAKRIGFFPDEQTWIPAVPSGDLAGGRYWVGFWNDSPIKPEDLVRDNPFDGYFVTLDDKNEWAIPAAVLIPQSIRLNEQGEVIRIVKDEFRNFWDRSIRAYKFIIEVRADADTINVDADWWDYLVLSLKLNYRITPEVVSHLQLFSDTTAIEAIIATVRGQEIVAVEKDLSEKKTLEPAETPAG